MIVTAGLGIASERRNHPGPAAHESDINIRAASVHMLGDALGSVAIIVGAIGDPLHRLAGDRSDSCRSSSPV